MSTTTLTTPQPAITKANTPLDVVRAMENDPAIQSAILTGVKAVLANKAALRSKTLWVSILSPVVMAVFAHFGLTPDQATVADIVTTGMSVVMAGLRLVTTTPITSVAAPKV